MSEAVFEIDLVEVTDHVLGLVLGIVYFLDTVEDDGEDDLVGHYACALQEVLVALLDAFDR